MVERLQQLLQQLESQGNASLFLVAKMDEYADRLTILFAAPWIVDQPTRQEAFQIIWNYLNTNFSPEERLSIARIGVFGSTEPLILKFNNYLTQYHFYNQLPIRSTNFQVNGNYIYDATIIAWLRT